MKIYLDQNKWIDLLKAIHYPDKHKQHIAVASLVRDKAKKGEWIFPISMVHFLETINRKDIGSRKDLAGLISTVSGQYSIAPFFSTQKQEFINAFAVLHDPKKIIPIEAITNSLFNFTGDNKPTLEFDTKKSSNLSKEFINELQGLLDKVTQRSDLFKMIVSMHNYEEIVSDQKSKDEDSKLQWEKWKADYVRLKKGKKYHAFLIAFFSHHVAHYTDDLCNEFSIQRSSLYPDSLIADKDKTINFLESIPSMDVRIKLMNTKFKNQSSKIHPHDHKDVAFLSTAIPYCDVVITEKEWVNYAEQSKLGKKYNTSLHKDINYLLELV